MATPTPHILFLGSKSLWNEYTLRPSMSSCNLTLLHAVRSGNVTWIYLFFLIVIVSNIWTYDDSKISTFLSVRFSKWNISKVGLEFICLCTSGHLLQSQKLVLIWIWFHVDVSTLKSSAAFLKNTQNLRIAAEQKSSIFNPFSISKIKLDF